MKIIKKEYPFHIEYLNEQGQLHRLDGPAVESVAGNKWWYINDNLHREDGPAVEYANGDKSWFLNGIKYSEDQYPQELIKLKLNRIKDL